MEVRLQKNAIPEKVISQAQELFQGIPLGIGIKDEEPCIRVYKTRESQDPETLGGFILDYVGEMGPIFALQHH